MHVLDLDLDFFVSPVPDGGYFADSLIDGRRSGDR
jgi:hypothetical protein